MFVWTIVFPAPGVARTSSMDIISSLTFLSWSSLTNEDLCRPKTDDPFLYYSKPSLGADLTRAMMATMAIPSSIGTGDSSSSHWSSSISSDFRQHQDALVYHQIESLLSDEIVICQQRHTLFSILVFEKMLFELQELDTGDTDDEMDCSVTEVDDVVLLPLRLRCQSD